LFPFVGGGALDAPHKNTADRILCPLFCCFVLRLAFAGVLAQELIEDELSLTHCIFVSVYLHFAHDNRPRSGFLIIITRKIEPFNPAQSSKNDLRDNNILL
jgi:hypothetical protein